MAVFSLSSRLHQPGWLSGAIHVGILFGAAISDNAAVWPYALLAMSAVSFFAWAANYRRYRHIHDIPTSKVAYAAQGYVELFGRTEMLPGEPVRSRLSRTACCWYSYVVEEVDSENRNQTIDRGTSVEHFLLVDNTGQCVISPEGADVMTHVRKSWSESDRRYSEWLLLPKSNIYAIGEFSTASAAAVTAGEERSDVGALLAQWKTDRRALHERFDLDRDRTISVKEWELARLEAQREVRARHAEVRSRSTEGVHILRKPADGRLFLLANEMPEKIGSRYRYWSFAHLIVFIGAGIAGVIML